MVIRSEAKNLFLPLRYTSRVRHGVSKGAVPGYDGQVLPLMAGYSRVLRSSLSSSVSSGPRVALQAQNKSAAPGKPAPTHTPDDPQIFRNTTFGFRYQIPYGWVNRTKEMQEGNEAAKGGVLLAVFERPPEATGDTVNSAVVIASESAATYPGLKTGGRLPRPSRRTGDLERIQGRRRALYTGD